MCALKTLNPSLSSPFYLPHPAAVFHPPPPFFSPSPQHHHYHPRRASKVGFCSCLLGFSPLFLVIRFGFVLAHIEGFLGVIIQRPLELNVCAKSNLISSPCDLQQCYPGDHARTMSTLHSFVFFRLLIHSFSFLTNLKNFIVLVDLIERIYV